MQEIRLYKKLPISNHASLPKMVTIQLICGKNFDFISITETSIFSFLFHYLKRFIYCSFGDIINWISYVSLNSIYYVNLALYIRVSLCQTYIWK